MLADRSRYLILATLMDGRAKTAKELAYAAKITAQTASSHLGKLMRASIIALTRQGRHSYYRIAREDVAQAIETIMAIDGRGEFLGSDEREALTPLQQARFCYDHLAGKLGVGLLRCLLNKRYLTEAEGNYRITSRGEIFFSELGLDLQATRAHRRRFACACMDWSERRAHLGGALGFEIAQQMIAKKWMRRHPESRVVTLTPSGKKALQEKLELHWTESR